MEGIEKITNEQIKACGVQALADRPNDSAKYGAGGLTPTELKRWFDKLSEVLAGKINGLIDVIYDGKAQDHISITFYGEKIKLSDFIKKFDSGELAGNILKLYPSALAEELQSLQSVINAIDKAIKDNAEVIGAELGATLDICVDEAQQLKVRLFSREDKQGERKELYSHSVSLIAGTERIADGAVTNGKLAAKSVTSEKIADGAVGTAAMADNSVTGEKIGDASIGYDKLSHALRRRLLVFENHLFEMDLKFVYGNIDSISGEVFFSADENGEPIPIRCVVTPNLVRANKPISTEVYSSENDTYYQLAVYMYDKDCRFLGSQGLFGVIQDVTLDEGTEYIRLAFFDTSTDITEPIIPLENGHLEGFKYWDDYYALELEERIETAADAAETAKASLDDLESLTSGLFSVDLDPYWYCPEGGIIVNQQPLRFYNPVSNSLEGVSVELELRDANLNTLATSGRYNTVQEALASDELKDVKNDAVYHFLTLYYASIYKDEYEVIKQFKYWDDIPTNTRIAELKEQVRALTPKVSAEGGIVRLDDVNPILNELDIKAYGYDLNTSSKVLRYGKNLIDPEAYLVNSDGTTLENDVFTTAFTSGTLFFNVLARNYANSEKQNLLLPGTYTFTIIPQGNTMNFGFYVYDLWGKQEYVWYAQDISDTWSVSFHSDVCFFIALGGLTGHYGKYNYKVMLEVGGVSTEYERYITPTIYYPDENGVVSGVRALSSSTTLVMDEFECGLKIGYVVDILERLERLENAIISLGGNI